MDAANLFKPMLARGQLRCIGSTTLEEYRKYVEKDAAFESRTILTLVALDSSSLDSSITDHLLYSSELRHPGASWNLFSEELCKRFAETTGEEVVEIYNKSKQLGSIEEYQEKFEELKSQVLESMKTGSRGKGTVRKETKEALKPVDYRKLGKRKAVVEADKKPAMKRKAAKKDPNKPKRPPSAFFVFLEEFRKTFKKENPDVKGVAAVGKAGGEKWKSMSAAEKAPYEAKAAKKKAEYGSLVDGYNKKQESSADEGGKESERSKSEVHDEDDESVQEEEDDDGEEEDEEEEDDDDD
ncbi:unnamed protein product [Fraxinus pennsylvanica]|uniref:HMG box domain-containing protein n=1 Tax=Fraxinus pennsylvanica TaxID=56036 RepID=A0AAD1Z2X5_9LAMI|nr:unnamed protein product [Fraxinus pennsylvanica]